MNEKIESLLTDEIVREIEGLASMNPSTDEYAEAVESLVKLYKLRIEELRCKNERDDMICDCLDHIDDTNIKKKQLSFEKMDRFFKLGVDLAGIILPLAFYAVWMKRGFKFEETGTYTSGTFKNLFNRFKPTIK
jgi:hypothetical protein